MAGIHFSSIKKAVRDKSENGPLANRKCSQIHFDALIVGFNREGRKATDLTKQSFDSQKPSIEGRVSTLPT